MIPDDASIIIGSINLDVFTTISWWAGARFDFFFIFEKPLDSLERWKIPKDPETLHLFQRLSLMVIILHFIERRASCCLQVRQNSNCSPSSLQWNKMSSPATAPPDLKAIAEAFQKLASVNHRVNINASTPILGWWAVLSSPFSMQLLAWRGSHMISSLALTRKSVTVKKPKIKHVLSETTNSR